MEWRKIFVSYVIIDQSDESYFGNASIAIDGLILSYDHIESLQYRLAEKVVAKGPIKKLIILSWREFEGAADGDTRTDGG